MRLSLPKLLSASALILLIAGSSALVSSACGTDCNTDFCHGPLTIAIRSELIPEDAHVELFVNGKQLNCVTRYESNMECLSDYLDRPDLTHVQTFEVKSMPKAISILIVAEDGEVLATYDETPEYRTINANSCSEACHRNASLRIGDFGGDQGSF